MTNLLFLSKQCFCSRRECSLRIFPQESLSIDWFMKLDNTNSREIRVILSTKRAKELECRHSTYCKYNWLCCSQSERLTKKKWLSVDKLSVGWARIRKRQRLQQVSYKTVPSVLLPSHSILPNLISGRWLITLLS